MRLQFHIIINLSLNIECTGWVEVAFINFIFVKQVWCFIFILMISLDKRATKMETEHHIERWDSTHELYKRTLTKLKQRNEATILCDLLTLANERAFYCSLKRKYCGKYLGESNFVIYIWLEWCPGIPGPFYIAREVYKTI